MADDFIALDIKGVEELRGKLSQLGGLASDTVTDDVSAYMKNVMQSSQPSPNYITRTQAYGQPFQSDRQRRWFYAALADGTLNVPYSRTQEMRNSWQVIGAGGQNAMLVNDAPGAAYVMGDNTQANQPRLVGWKTVKQVVSDHMSGVMRVADAAVKRAIKILGL
jgi:hypothetical protein